MGRTPKQTGDLPKLKKVEAAIVQNEDEDPVSPINQERDQDSSSQESIKEIYQTLKQQARRKRVSKSSMAENANIAGPGSMNLKQGPTSLVE